jgi:protein-tyrosine phosphatase
VCEEDLAAADHIIAVKEAEHRPLVERKFPKWRDRIEYWHVHDLDCATPDEAMPCLEREVLRLVERLAAQTRAA